MWSSTAVRIMTEKNPNDHEVIKVELKQMRYQRNGGVRKHNKTSHKKIQILIVRSEKTSLRMKPIFLPQHYPAHPSIRTDRYFLTMLPVLS